jgi:hypothetical protein
MENILMGLFAPSAPKRYALGRLPDDRRQARIVLRESATPITPPASADWVTGITSWGMSLNDKIGDCTIAGLDHWVMQQQHYGQNKTVSIPDSATLSAYEAVSGYNPRNPSSDVGATLQSALNYGRNPGIGGYKVDAFAQIDSTNLNLVRNCINIFGCVYSGLNLPSSAQTQFGNGQEWTVVRSGIDGGHCVPLMAFDAASFTAVTWGAAQQLTVAFYQRYFDETWVPISLSWLEATGMSPGGLDTDALNSDYLALTGMPGPFPQGPTPIPSPPVTPPPVVPGTADVTMANAARAWLTARGL